MYRLSFFNAVPFNRCLTILGLLLTLLFGAVNLTAQPNNHAAISINGDSGFTREKGVSAGSGTAQDPFIIENMRIDAAGQDFAIILQNTRAHVIVRNCELFNARLMGIQLFQVKNVTVERCLTHGNKRGFNVVDSTNVRLVNNVAQFNQMQGFGVFDSQNVSFFGNVARYNWDLAGGQGRSWGFFADRFSQTRGQDNLSTGHLFDIIVIKVVPEAKELPRQQQEEADYFGIFSSPPREPETSCTQIFNEFFLFVDRAPDAPPLTEAYCSELFSSLSSLPIHLRSRINQIFFQADDAEILGLFTGVGTIRLKNISHLKLFTMVAFHETGHAIQSSFFNNQLQTQWSKLFQRSGGDIDNFAMTISDSLSETGEVLRYGSFNDHEDFATLFDAYTRDTEGLITRAHRIEAQTGKTLLLDKINFLTTVFQRGSAPFAYRMLIDWDSEAETVDLRLQRTEVLLESGIPVITEALVWEEF